MSIASNVPSWRLQQVLGTSIKDVCSLTAATCLGSATTGWGTTLTLTFRAGLVPVRTPLSKSTLPSPITWKMTAPLPFTSSSTPTVARNVEYAPLML